MFYRFFQIILAFIVIIPLNLRADTYSYVSEDQDLIGKIRYVPAKKGDNLASIGRRYDIGHVEMIEANPDLDPEDDILESTEVIIPSEYILPPGKREGIVINLAELRLYYYHPDEPYVTTEPIGIGRQGWNTPVGQTSIVEKKKDPYWFPTDNMKNDAIERGEPLPDFLPPGDDNPLGRYALRLGWTEYLIHGTNIPAGVGRRSSAGCIRMYSEDIEKLFSLVKVGTKVRIINEPIKHGWSDGTLFLEAHAPLSEDLELMPDWSEIVERIDNIYQEDTLVSWGRAQEVLNYHVGLPIPIGGKA